MWPVLVLLIYCNYYIVVLSGSMMPGLQIAEFGKEEVEPKRKEHAWLAGELSLWRAHLPVSRHILHICILLMRKNGLLPDRLFESAVA